MMLLLITALRDGDVPTSPSGEKRPLPGRRKGGFSPIDAGSP